MSSKIAYFDCCSGISGDMVLGALIDCGLDIKMLRKELAKLDLKDYAVSAAKDERHHIVGTNLSVRFKESKRHRTFKDIKTLISRSRLSQRVKDLSISIFANLAKAEAKIHGCKPDDVHFHEVGAIDSIVDIVSTAILMDRLHITKVYCSIIAVGHGMIKFSHGTTTLPVPAVRRLLKGYPLHVINVPKELVTPTGAAVLKAMAKPLAAHNIDVIKKGFGAGTRDLPFPNIVEAWLIKNPTEHDHQVLLETNIDDMNPELFPFVLEKLMQNGA